MLLFGDAQKEIESVHDLYMESKFDPLWGAGRLKARIPDEQGMDAPGGWYFGWRCVAQDQEMILNVNGGQPLSSDVDTMKSVIWWYDRRHEIGQTIDDIDLTLQKKYSSGNWGAVRYSIDRTDNKERVIYNNFGPSGSESSFRLIIKGKDVTADEEGCGMNKMKVYYAYYWEDSDRDDSNGPYWNSNTRIGVEPDRHD